MISIQLGFISGVMVGVEILSGNKDYPFKWSIAFDLLIIRLIVQKY